MITSIIDFTNFIIPLFTRIHAIEYFTQFMFSIFVLAPNYKLGREISLFMLGNTMLALLDSNMTHQSPGFFSDSESVRNAWFVKFAIWLISCLCCLRN